jgi:hypothetical protein
VRFRRNPTRRIGRGAGKETKLLELSAEETILLEFFASNSVPDGCEGVPPINNKAKTMPLSVASVPVLRHGIAARIVTGAGTQITESTGLAC